jgi:uncharacterized protein (TIGR02001 family)
VVNKFIVGALLVGGSGFSGNAMSDGELSYNVSFASEYYTKGVFQKESSASAGADYTNKGFYAGAWTADVGEGLEVDGYFGYAVETSSGFTTSLGYTGYFYTGDFDDTYQEINLNMGYNIVNLEHSFGQWDGFGDKQDYTYTALTVDLSKGFYGKYGRFDKDFEGEYFEAGYKTSISSLDVGISTIFSSKELSNEGTNEKPKAGEALIFTIGKTF